MLGPPKIAQLYTTTHHVTSYDWWRSVYGPCGDTPSPITTHHVTSCGTRICHFQWSQHFPFSIVIFQGKGAMTMFGIHHYTQLFIHPIEINSMVHIWFTLSLENIWLVLSNVDKIIKTQQTHFLSSWRIIDFDWFFMNR